jgi:hypothetical protein
MSLTDIAQEKANEIVREVAIVEGRLEQAYKENAKLRSVIDAQMRPRERALYVKLDGSIEWGEPYAGTDGPMRVVRRARTRMEPIVSHRDYSQIQPTPMWDERFHLIGQCNKTLVYVEV